MMDFGTIKTPLLVKTNNEVQKCVMGGEAFWLVDSSGAAIALFMRRDVAEAVAGWMNEGSTEAVNPQDG